MTASSTLETSMRLGEQEDRLNEILGNKYHILCRIGGGGMAHVYLARHRVHGGLFAVKVLVDHLAEDERIVARFEQEARMAATLASHPNIVPIFDISSGAGLHYMIMQFIPGEDLASYLRRNGRLNLPDAANVVAQATEALSCAEAKRIVHRDLKLANMLLDQSGRVKLLDFGISRITDVADGLTRPGESIGTPHYMSPEQIRGEACDIRSDLYSLGVVFFELISGRPPFENESVTAIQIAHLSTPPPSLLSLDPGLPPGCDAIVQKLLAKAPEQRYQTTAELLGDLIAHGAHAGPGILRPEMDLRLREAIERAEAMPLDNSTTPVATAILPDPPASGTSRTTPGAVDLQPEPLPTATVHEPTRHELTAKRSPKVSIALVAVAVLVIVTVVIGFMVLRPKPVTTGDEATTHSHAESELPQFYSDTHGRMVLVAAGSFLFGQKGTSEAKSINLPPFYIDETEVSNAEYQRFCQATGHPAPQSPGFTTHPDYPVSGVSNDEAIAYASWAGKRLPTEEEWEKAARGTDERTFPWGDTPWNAAVPTQLESVNSEASRRSPYGAYNMAGNVWEWTDTPYTPLPSDLAAMRRLVGGQSFSSSWKIIKGGSFSPGGSENFAISKRRGLPTDGRSPWIGFRCVRDVKPSS